MSGWGSFLGLFLVLRWNYRESNRAAFYRDLAENGEREVKELREAFS